MDFFGQNKKEQQEQKSKDIINGIIPPIPDSTSFLEEIIQKKKPSIQQMNSAIYEFSDTNTGTKMLKSPIITDQKKTVDGDSNAKIKKYYSTKFKKWVVEKEIKKSISISDSKKYQEDTDKINLFKKTILSRACGYNNIIKIYDIKENPLSIMMEYCEKGNLRDILDKGFYLPSLYKVFLILSICEGLDDMRRNGILHGNLKSTNILLSDEKNIILVTNITQFLS